MGGAEHPLIAAHAADAEAHLVGQGLEAQGTVAGCQGAGNFGAGGLPPEHGDGFFEAALEQVHVALVGNQGAGAGGCAQRDVEAVDGIEEEERPHALVETRLLAPVLLQRRALGEEFGQRGGIAKAVERLIANLRIGRIDDLRQAAHRALRESS